MAIAVDPLKFLREVRVEMSKVTWPTRKETTVTTALVFAMAALAALFFFLIDQVAGFAVSVLFAHGG